MRINIAFQLAFVFDSRSDQTITILIKQYKFLRELVFCCFGKGLGTEEGAEIDDREDDPIGVGLFICENEADDLFGDSSICVLDSRQFFCIIETIDIVIIHSLPYTFILR